MRETSAEPGAFLIRIVRPHAAIGSHAFENCSVRVSDFVDQLNVTTELVNNIICQPAYVITEKLNVIVCGGGSIGTLFESNQLSYSERTPRSAAPATGYGMLTDMRFVSAVNYHLRNGSPAIGASIPFEGLTRDFDAVLWLNPPPIDAFE